MVTSDNKTADTDEKIFIGKGEETAWLDARACQPAWPRHRSDRNRQDGLAAGDGGRLCARRCSRVRIRYQGRLVRHLRSRRGQGLHPQARQGDGPRFPAGPVLDGVLGRVRRAGPSGSRHGHGDGAVVAVADARSERRAGRRYQCRIPRRGRKRLDAARHEGSAVAAGCDRAGRRQKKGPDAEEVEDELEAQKTNSERPHRATAMSARRQSEPSNASCWCWKTRAERNSSASRRWC